VCLYHRQLLGKELLHFSFIVRVCATVRGR
jgi:hypothetical protein